MQFVVTMNVDNACFGEDDAETRAQMSAKILRDIADKIDVDSMEGLIRDDNGNVIGSYAFQE